MFATLAVSLVPYGAQFTSEMGQRETLIQLSGLSFAVGEWWCRSVIRGE